MPEEIATVKGPHGGYEQVRYDNGSHHVNELRTDSDGNTKKIHVKTDDMLDEMAPADYDKSSNPWNPSEATPLGSPDNPGEPTPLTPSTPESPPTRDLDPSTTSTLGDVSIKFRDAHAPVIAPVFNNNPNINVGQQNLGDVNVGNIGGGFGGGSGERPTTPGERPPTGERPGGSEEVDNLKKELTELKEQFEGLKKQLEELVEQLKKDKEEKDEKDEKEKKNPLEEARKSLEDARNNLLDITIRRRARMWDGHTNRGAGDGEAYGPAMEAYKEQLANYLKVMREDLTSKEVEEAEIRRKLTEAMYEERANFAKEEVAKNNAELDRLAKGEGKGFFGKLFGKRANLLRWWANKSTLTKIGISLGAGVGIALASAGLGASAALLGAGGAFKFSLGLLNRRASLRNVSERGLKKELSGIDAARAKALEALGLAPDEQELFDKGLIDHVQSDLDGRVQRAQRMNRFGNAIMLLSVPAAAAGVAGMEGWMPNPHLPVPGRHGFFHLPGFLHHHSHNSEPFPTGAGGGEVHNSIDLAQSGFHPNQFGGKGMDPQEVVRSMFHVFNQNGYHVDPNKISDSQLNQIIGDMQNQHLHIAFGMDAGGHQHLVDAAQGLSGSHTPNEYASGLAGLKDVNAWQKVMDIAVKRGVPITKG